MVGNVQFSLFRKSTLATFGGCCQKITLYYPAIRNFHFSLKSKDALPFSTLTLLATAARTVSLCPNNCQQYRREMGDFKGEEGGGQKTPLQYPAIRNFHYLLLFPDRVTVSTWTLLATAARTVSISSNTCMQVCFLERNSSNNTGFGHFKISKAHKSLNFHPIWTCDTSKQPRILHRIR